MGVTPSGTDENFYHELLKHVDDFYIIMIANKKGEMTLRLYDIPNNLLFYDLEFDFAMPGQSGTAWYEEQAKQIKPKVTAVSKYYPKLDAEYYKREAYYFDEEEDIWTNYQKKSTNNVKEFRKLNQVEMLETFEDLEIHREVLEASEEMYDCIMDGYHTLPFKTKKKGKKKNVKSK
jgi:hypothetical protein